MIKFSIFFTVHFDGLRLMNLFFILLAIFSEICLFTCLAPHLKLYTKVWSSYCPQCPSLKIWRHTGTHVRSIGIWWKSAKVLKIKCWRLPKNWKGVRKKWEAEVMSVYAPCLRILSNNSTCCDECNSNGEMSWPNEKFWKLILPLLLTKRIKFVAVFVLVFRRPFFENHFQNFIGSSCMHPWGQLQGRCQWSLLMILAGFLHRYIFII